MQTFTKKLITSLMYKEKIYHSCFFMITTIKENDYKAHRKFVRWTAIPKLTNWVDNRENYSDSIFINCQAQLQLAIQAEIELRQFYYHCSRRAYPTRPGHPEQFQKSLIQQHLVSKTCYTRLAESKQKTTSIIFPNGR